MEIALTLYMLTGVTLYFITLPVEEETHVLEKVADFFLYVTLFPIEIYRMWAYYKKQKTSEITWEDSE